MKRNFWMCVALAVAAGVVEAKTRSVAAAIVMTLAAMMAGGWRPNSMIAPLTREEMESRRMQAAQLFAVGIRQSEIARAVGVSRTTASRWRRAIEGGGTTALARRKAPGRPPRFDWNARADELRALYAGAAPIHKTTAGFALLIGQRYGVRFDPDHVSRVMKRLDFGRRRSRRNLQPYAATSPETIPDRRQGFSISA